MPHSPWGIADGWRLGHGGECLLSFLYRGERLELRAHGSAGDYTLETGGSTQRVEGAAFVAGRLVACVDGRQHRVRTRADDRRVLVHDGDQRFTLERVPAFLFDEGDAAAGADRLVAPMPGRVVVVKAQAGQVVEEGQELMVMEAMKMELSLRAPRAGTIARVQAAEGEFVESDAVLVTLEEP